MWGSSPEHTVVSTLSKEKLICTKASWGIFSLTAHLLQGSTAGHHPLSTEWRGRGSLLWKLLMPRDSREFSVAAPRHSELAQRKPLESRSRADFCHAFLTEFLRYYSAACTIEVRVCACVGMMLLEHIQTLCFPLFFVGKLLRGDQR